MAQWRQDCRNYHEKDWAITSFISTKQTAKSQNSLRSVLQNYAIVPTTLLLIYRVMKVILLKDVAKIGRRYEVVVVPDGFALNKLIPRKMAEAATGESLKRLQNVSSKQTEDKEHQLSAFKDALLVLEDTPVTLEVEANAEGRMFSALKADAIAQAVQKSTQLSIGAEQIVLKSPIKSTGEHKIELVSGPVHGTLTLILTSKSK